ncbi:MAG TPA: ACT domain-containing protein [Acidimicrobiales bacterium]
MAIRDLSLLLKNLSVTRRPGRWCMVSDVAEPITAAATIVEDEGVTSVVSVADAERLGIAPDFVAAWLTLDMRSALDAVGLTATVATALFREGIPCNVLAGYHHDHLLVPEHEADRAVAILLRLRPSPPQGSLE